MSHTRAPSDASSRLGSISRAPSMIQRRSSITTKRTGSVVSRTQSVQFDRTQTSASFKSTGAGAMQMRNLIEKGSDGRVESLIFQKVQCATMRTASVTTQCTVASHATNVVAKFLAHWQNKTISKAFNQWSSSMLMHHRAMVRKGNCPCGLPGRATFKTADNPALVILCNCEACMGQRDPSSVAVYTDYHEMVAVRGIKHDDTLVRDHTEAESGRWTIKYSWQALGLKGPQSIKQINEVEIDTDTMQAWVCEACGHHVMFSHRERNICCFASCLFANNTTLMEGQQLTELDTNRRSMSLHCAGYMTNLHATALLAEIGDREPLGQKYEQIQPLEQKRVRRIRVPAVPPSKDRYPGGASQRLKTLKMGQSKSGSMTHRGGLESGRVDALRLDSAPPGTPALAPLKSLYHARRQGEQGMHQQHQHQQQQHASAPMVTEGGDERAKLQLRLPLGGVGGGGDSTGSAEVSFASDGADVRAGKGGSVTERGTSGWRDPAWEGGAARGAGPARLSPLKEDSIAHSPQSGAAKAKHFRHGHVVEEKNDKKPRALTWRQQWLLDIEKRKYHEPYKEVEDKHGPQAPWHGAYKPPRQTFDVCKAHTRDMMESACADADMVMAANGTAVQREMMRLSSIPFHSRTPSAEDSSSNKPAANAAPGAALAVSSMFSGAYLKGIQKFKQAAKAKKKVDYVVVAGGSSYAEVKGGIKLLQEAKRLAETSRIDYEKAIKADPSSVKREDYKWVTDTPWMGNNQEALDMGGTNPVDIGLDAPP